MSESKHTPGPCSTKIECQHAKDMYYGDRLDWQDFIAQLCPNCSQRAHQLAAAPELLAACKSIVEYSDTCLSDPLNPCWNNRPTDEVGKHWGVGNACAVCHARAAIAKAETACKAKGE